MEKSFRELKNWFIAALILTDFDPTKPCILELDALDIALGAIISHNYNKRRLHSIAIYSRKFQPAEFNY
jgi:hypothetical protein